MVPLVLIYKTCLFSVRDTSGMSAGQRFMTDLLVSSLMADGGLEFAMEAAIKKETQAFEDKKVQVLQKLP